MSKNKRRRDLRINLEEETSRTNKTCIRKRMTPRKKGEDPKGRKNVIDRES